MKNLFERASSYWVRYDAYELRERQNGTLYVTPAKDAQPQVYNPLADPEKLVLDAMNVGMLAMGRKAPEVIQKGVLDSSVRSPCRHCCLGLLSSLFCSVREFRFSVGQRGWLLVDSGSLACGNGPSTKAS